MISFEEARQIVVEINGPDWLAKYQYRTAPWGLENETHYLVYDGPWVLIYDQDSEEADNLRRPDDGHWSLVNKETGVYEPHQGPDENGDLFNFVGTPVGDPAPEGWRPF